jgi:predicted outer membrane repeat protein
MLKSNKSLLVFLSILILFVFVSSASAADSNATNVLSIDESANIANNDTNILSVDNNGNILKEKTGSYSELVTNITNAQISGNEVTLEKNCIYTFDSGNTIEINKTGFKVKGNGAIIDMASSNITVFKITADNVIINNLTIKNTKSNDDGGAIYWIGHYGTVSECTFTNNTANNGGAIGWYGDNGTVSDCTFTNNTAKSNGGALYFSNSGNVTTCNFTGNTATNSGAIHIDGSVSGNLGGIFINNKASNSGGAIGMYSPIYGNLRGIFINNTANNKGGAISNTETTSNIVIQDSIFINNNNTIYSNSAHITAIDCWFGNNATNYNIKPENIGTVTITDWLFLNATANPAELNVGQTSIITFKLDSYNTTSNTTSSYDASKMNATIKLSQTLGELNKNSTLIGEEVIYAAKQEGNASVTGKVGTAFYTIDLKNNDNPINVTAENLTKYYGSSEQFVVNVTDKTGQGVSGKLVSITINGRTYNRTTDENGTVRLNINLPSGNYTADIIIDNISINSTVTVLPTVTGSNITAHYNETIIYNATFLDSNGNYLSKGTEVSFNIDGKIRNKTICDDKGLASLNISNYEVGEYIITATNTVTGENAINTINITKSESDLVVIAHNISVSEVNAVIADIVLPGYVTGNVNVTVANKTTAYDIQTSEHTSRGGKTVMFIRNNGLESGEYNITAVYEGDRNYKASNGSSIFSVSAKKDLILNASTFTIGENVTVFVTGFENATGNITVTAGDNNYISSIMMSMAFVSIPKSDKNITAYIYYPGDDKYNNASTTVDIIAKKDLNLTAIAEPVTVGENATIIITGFENATGNVMVIAGRGFYNVTIINGTAKAITKELNNTTTAYILYLGDDNYNMAFTSVNITVNPKSDVVIVAENVTKYYSGPERFVANIYDPEGNPLVNKSVNITINGVTYTRTTDDNGTVSLAIRLGSGTYTVTTTVDNTTVESSITVLSTVKGSDLTKYYRNATQYSVQIFNTNGTAVGKGEVVTFNVNGIFYNRTTDENGIATLNINLPPGNYIITSDYKGCRIANNITVLSVLNAEDITMKYLDGTQFVATLVDGQGNPYKDQFVRFNINGKFYNRLTDSNGKSALNIRLLPGEYIITSSFNGANIANKITVSGVL